MGFNSIKVRLRHNERSSIHYALPWFQFHKGAIKTVRVSVIGLKLICFNSIKVRLRRYFLCLTSLTPIRFQFHKGAIKTKVDSDLFLDCLLFQFHKGAIKTPSASGIIWSFPVSIP